MNELKQFYGTEKYHQCFMGVLLTDGVKYVADELKCHWVFSDAGVILKMKLKDEEFVTVNLIAENSKAKIVYTDGNETTLYTQEYGYTDLPDINLKFFYTNNVMMLPSEY